MAANPSAPPQSSHSNAERLDSWKAIANHLGRDVRTVIRWEKERHLPVRRVPGGHVRSVFAFSDELDAWMEGEHGAFALAPDMPVPSETLALRSRRIRRRHVVGFAMAAVVAVVLFTRPGLRDSSTVISRLAAGGQTLEAFDVSGRRLWTYALPGRLLQPLDVHNLTIEDIDDDGQSEAVIGMVMAAADGSYLGRLVVFDSLGRVRWERALPDTLTFGATEYGPPWLPTRVLVHRLPDGTRRIVVSAHHLTWWPDIVTAFDIRGAPVGRYVNPGWIYDLRATPDGRQLLAAGVTNALGGHVLAVLNSARIDGTSPQGGRPEFACRNCPEGAPERYFFVPWSDLASPEESPRTSVWVFPSGQIELHCPQVFGSRHPTIPEAIIDFSAALTVTARRVSDAFWPLHEELERSGRLAHNAAACPWRDGPSVYTWTAELAWRPHSPEQRR